jgi:hypothetical protein
VDCHAGWLVQDEQPGIFGDYSILEPLESAFGDLGFGPGSPRNRWHANAISELKPVARAYSAAIDPNLTGANQPVYVTPWYAFQLAQQKVIQALAYQLGIYFPIVG